MKIVVYDFATSRISHQFDASSPFVRWLPDGRRLCFFTFGGERLMVVDIDSGRMQQVDVRLPLPNAGDSFAITPDGRTILYGGTRSEADIWIVERK